MFNLFFPEWNHFSFYSEMSFTNLASLQQLFPKILATGRNVILLGDSLCFIRCAFQHFQDCFIRAFAIMAFITVFTSSIYGGLFFFWHMARMAMYFAYHLFVYCLQFGVKKCVMCLDCDAEVCFIISILRSWLLIPSTMS